MKRFFFLIIALVIVASCGTTRHVVTDHHQTVDYGSVQIRNEIERIWSDSVHNSATNVQITKIEFFDSDRNRKEGDSTATEPVLIVTSDADDDSSVRDLIADAIKGRADDIKSITTIDINRTDSTATSSSGIKTATDTAAVVVHEAVDDHQDDTKEIAGGSKGSLKMKAVIWITIVLLLVGAFFYFFGFRKL